MFSEPGREGNEEKRYSKCSPSKKIEQSRAEQSRAQRNRGRLALGKGRSEKGRAGEKERRYLVEHLMLMCVSFYFPYVAEAIFCEFLFFKSVSFKLFLLSYNFFLLHAKTEWENAHLSPPPKPRRLNLYHLALNFMMLSLNSRDWLRPRL